MQYDLPWHWKNSQINITVCGFPGVKVKLCHLLARPQNENEEKLVFIESQCIQVKKTQRFRKVFIFTVPCSK